MDEFIDAFRRIAPFGELQKARDACDDAEAEAARVAALPHPDLPAAQAALTAAQQQKAQLLAQQTQLTGQIALADQPRGCTGAHRWPLHKITSKACKTL